jgi:hypothetical protein
MAILKEFTCAAHGPFDERVEGDEIPQCPTGCSPRFVRREIRTAPAMKTVISGRLDTLQRDIAHDFGLSDMKVSKDSNSSVMENLRRGEDFSPKWVDVPNKMKSGWANRGEQAGSISPTSLGLQGENNLAPVAQTGQLPRRIPTRIEGRDITKISDVSV